MHWREWWRTSVSCRRRRFCARKYVENLLNLCLSVFDEVFEGAHQALPATWWLSMFFVFLFRVPAFWCVVYSKHRIRYRCCFKKIVFFSRCRCGCCCSKRNLAQRNYFVVFSFVVVIVIVIVVVYLYSSLRCWYLSTSIASLCGSCLHTRICHSRLYISCMMLMFLHENVTALRACGAHINTIALRIRFFLFRSRSLSSTETNIKSFSARTWYTGPSVDWTEEKWKKCCKRRWRRQNEKHPNRIIISKYVWRLCNNDAQSPIQQTWWLWWSSCSWPHFVPLITSSFHVKWAATQKK